eukprot:11066782-Heterocapsa_arctica.AAC.1
MIDLRAACALKVKRWARRSPIWISRVVELRAACALKVKRSARRSTTRSSRVVFWRQPSRLSP